MMPVPGGIYSTTFTLLDGTGTPADADFAPVATASVDGVDDPGFVLGVASVTTGHYQVTGTVPPTYAAGAVVRVSIAATVDGIPASNLIDTFKVAATSSLIVAGDVPVPVGCGVVAANDALISALTSPASVSSDAGSVTQRSVDDLIRARNYLAGACAAAQGRSGLRFTRLVPDGAVNAHRHWRFNRIGGW
jgi:hypothetical protein